MAICVIGAGPCGLTALKNLKLAGLDDVVCYEAGDQIGGNWVFKDSHGHSSVYETTHTITSKRFCEFEDFPMPRNYPDFPSHVQILEYFQSYADHFDLQGKIQFSTKVTSAISEGEGGWRVNVLGPAGEESHQFTHLLICSGHHWNPLQPELPGNFTGTQLHAHDYKSAAEYQNQRVLVVGGGNSACDIAVETSRVSTRTALSMRRGYHIIPKIVFGMPVDAAYKKLLRLPKPIRQKVLGLLLRLAIGRWEKYGLEKPDCRPLEMHPTLNSEVLYSIRHGKIHPCRGIQSADGEKITFTDGTSGEFDVIIWATGYRTGFPFFGDLFSDWETVKTIPLYLKMMPADHSNLYFLGLFQPIGCIWTLADYQAKIAALQISGKLAPPVDLKKRIKWETDHPHWKFQSGARHSVEVDYHQFRKELLAELKSAVPY